MNVFSEQCVMEGKEGMEGKVFEKERFWSGTCSLLGHFGDCIAPPFFMCELWHKI